MDGGHPVRHVDGPSTGQYLYALVFIAAIGLVGILLGAFALAATACGCTRPPDLIVVNRSHAAATVNWRTSGVLGTPLLRSGGAITADACTVTTWPLDAGDVTAAIRVGDGARSVAFRVSRAAGQEPVFVLIDPDGRVGEPLAEWPPGTDDATSCP